MLLAKKQSKLQFLCDSFYASDCCIGLKYAFGLTAVMLLLVSWYFLNVVFFQSTASLAMIVELCILYVCVVFVVCVIVAKMEKRANPQKEWCEIIFSLLPGELIFLTVILTTIAGLIYLVIEYVFQDENTTTIADHAVYWSFYELLVFPLVILVIVLICTPVFSTAKSLFAKSQAFDANHALMQTKHEV